ncbi:MAG: hypothetical protein V1810_03010 [Candidatus Beckwithbacteria bacterium]
MTEIPLPLTSIVSRLRSIGFPPFTDFQNHIKPLDIKASGEVMIIGAGDWLEEVALLEPKIIDGSIQSLTLIGTAKSLAIPIIDVFNKNYQISMKIDGTSYGTYFDNNPNQLFDTIIFIGATMLHPTDSLTYLAKQLKPSGNLYVTINSRNIPNLPLQIQNCTVKIIPDIPPSPDYNDFPQYYGVVIKRQK